MKHFSTFFIKALKEGVSRAFGIKPSCVSWTELVIKKQTSTTKGLLLEAFFLRRSSKHLPNDNFLPYFTYCRVNVECKFRPKLPIDSFSKEEASGSYQVFIYDEAKKNHEKPPKLN